MVAQRQTNGDRFHFEFPARRDTELGYNRAAELIDVRHRRHV
jgi:hypothetical protein